MSENIILQTEENVVIATFNITSANTTITLKSLIGKTQIDWGDGTTNSELNHTYTTTGEHICKIYDVTTIGYGAFSGCSSLTSVVIGDSVTEIGSSAFRECSSLTSVVIGSSVTSIGNDAFKNCYRLVEVINKSTHITVIADSTNNGYVGDYALSVYNSDSGITESQLTNDNGYIIYTDSDKKILVGYNGTETDLVLPSYVTKINRYAFFECSSLTSVEIPSSVTNIGYDAFYNCTSLTSVVIPDSVTKIDEAAFERCSSLNSVYITDIEAWCNISFGLSNFNISTSNPLFYAKSLYLNNELVTDLIIPDGVTGIGGYAFINYTSMTSVEIPSSVTNIDVSAFYGCDSLVQVRYKGTIEEWCNITFGNIYANPLTMSNATLYLNGEPVNDLVIPGTVPHIDGSTFREYSGLTSLIISDGVISIDSCAFLSCENLTSIVISNSVTSIGVSAFERCISLTSVTIGNGVTSLDYETFRYCTNLTNVVIGDSITEIGTNVFSDCINLTNLTLGSSVTDISHNSFYGCNNIDKIYMKSTNPININGVHTGQLCVGNEHTTFYVPSESVELYRAAWEGIVAADKILGYNFDVFISLEGLKTYHSTLKEKYLDNKLDIDTYNTEKEAMMSNINTLETNMQDWVMQYIADNFATLMAEYLNSTEATENKPTAADISEVFNEDEEA